MNITSDFQPVWPYRHQEQPPPDPRAEFYSEYPTSGRGPRPTRRQPPAMLGLCVFERGREVQRGLACPHFREPEDG